MRQLAHVGQKSILLQQKTGLRYYSGAVGRYADETVEMPAEVKGLVV